MPILGRDAGQALNSAVGYSFIQASTWCSVSYGIVLILFLKCLHALYTQRTERRSSKLRSVVLTAYVCSVLLLQTLIFASALKFTQSTFVDHQKYSGGPGQYGLDTWFGRDNISNHVPFVVVKWLSDAFLIWRFYTLFASIRNPWMVLLASCCLYIASFVLSILFLIQVCGASHPPGPYSGWTAPFITAIPVLNIAIAIAIIARLVLQKHPTKPTRVSEPSPAPRITLSTILIESGFAHALHSIFFLSFYVARSSVALVFLQSTSQVQTATMFLIILKGKHWTDSDADVNISVTRTPARSFSLPTLFGDNTSKPIDLSDTWKRSGLTAQVSVRREVEVRSSLGLQPLRASYLKLQRAT